MLFDKDIKGNRLPPGTLCLTYDDGPGPHTPELGRYLFEQGIGAAFFVIGRDAEADLPLLHQLQGWGHLVGNHTYSHPGLVALATGGGDVVGELARTDAVIRPYVSGEAIFFRAPYGNWREKVGPDSPQDRDVSVVADILNRSGRFADYVGPVNWDIVAEDWVCWEQDLCAEECARRYLREIDRVGHGIVLMHDSSEEEAVRARNRTMQMTRLLVPVLKEKGYNFVRLDAVPQVRSATRVSHQVVVLTPDGQALSVSEGGAEEVVVSATETREAFGVVSLGGKRVALRASNGQYLSAREGSGEVRANSPTAAQPEALEVEDLGDGTAALRAAGGAYLTGERQGGRLRASAARRADAQPFLIRELFTAG